YVFAVRGMTLGFRKRPIESAFSNVAQAKLLDVSEPVADLQARATQNAVELNWLPIQKGLTGAFPPAFAGYRVYRSDSGKPDSFAILAEPPSPSYSDAAFEFDHSYYYIVMALFKSGSTVAVSGGSKTVEITPHDTFPPTVPSDVTGIYTAGAIEIVWTPSPEPDLAGYNVYRRSVGGVETKVNGLLVRTPVFRDQSVQAGQVYFYRATALDQAGNESARSAEIEVDTR
ncbi:MAG TPA: hypothetical protein VFM21_11575, partial [Terriglobia bacterium]|nr:hypothetical protein [Terriglobia bacterium]